jgi:hypothetical protein
VLAPGGRLFATFFLLDSDTETAISDGRADFKFAHEGNGARVEKAGNPDWAVAHDRESMLEALAERGFRVEAVLPGSWRGNSADAYQDIIVAVR